jgi:hypothetical protein
MSQIVNRESDAAKTGNKRKPNFKPKLKSKPRRMILGDYEVGYGKPPVGNRWAPGESGNRRGRPVKPKVGERTLDYFMSERIAIPTDNGPQIYTRRELMYLQLANRAAKADDRAVAVVRADDAANGAGKRDVADPLLFDPALTRDLLEAFEKDVAEKIKTALPGRRRKP